MKIHVPVSQKELTQCVEGLLAHAQSAPVIIGLDTEFWRVRTYWPQLCLMQVCVANDVYIIDPTLLDVSVIAPVLVHDNIIKIMHAADQDCEIFMHDFNVTPVSVLDTQIASRLLNMGRQVGYASLVMEVMAVTLDKSEQHGKWRDRPLTEEQTSYAARDVLYLPQLYHFFEKRLTEENLINAWRVQSGEMILHVKNSQDPANVWRRWNNNRYSPPMRERLKILAEFRERLAQERNIPRTRIFTDEALVSLIMNPVESKETLKRLKGVSSWLPAHEAFWELIVSMRTLENSTS
ncbi:MAG: HRDC domain-containing protein [Alphaproteobacteria bacterium]|nr:MAG: HRDC domain-containing protein [Alphaproteobacteria bacterium]